MLNKDLVCFSHLRWAFTFQRPNHLMARAAQKHRVFYIEEPVYEKGDTQIAFSEPLPNLWVCTPRVAPGTSDEQLRELLHRFLRERQVTYPVLWVYSPMLFPLVQGLEYSVLVHDCMDELSLFLQAPPALLEREAELFRAADLVFTGGRSLYEAKRQLHPRVYSFPSSVDIAHFSPSRELVDPLDQQPLSRPRVGFFGVIDERMDLDLIERLAEERPHYQFVLVGPVVKISETTLPRATNLHYLGPRTYDELPAYLTHWDVAIMPFALNDATRFISPTKTLEYLAAGKPVVSTAVRDVVDPYGELGVVRIAGHRDFAHALDEALKGPDAARFARTDQVLNKTSWDATWASMSKLIGSVESARLSMEGSQHV